jgi:putative transcriptional regulator
MTSMSKLQNQLRDHRRRQQLTQQALAEKVGVTRQTIIAVEQGKFVPSVRLALGLARALELQLEELFWIEEGTTG